MTSDTKLRAAVCEALFSAVGLRARWTAEGPSPQLDAVLCPEQRTMVGIANAVWGQTVPVGLSDVWNELDPNRLSLIGTLLVAAAYGDQGLADWLEIEVGDHKGERRGAMH